MRRWYYTTKAKLVCAAYTLPLRVNGKTSLTPTTYLGKNVHFNGMEIRGGGKVTIGDNFHSGKDCLMITQNHNYDEGNSLPYDSVYVYKDITIHDNVWLGDRAGRGDHW